MRSLSDPSSLVDRPGPSARSRDDVREDLHIALDDARVAASRELAVARTARAAACARQRMDDIHRAYARLADGRFGRCVRCDVAVPHERLLHRPESPWCEGCEPVGRPLRPDPRAVAVRDAVFADLESLDLRSF